jgi:hypothetical protein
LLSGLRTYWAYVKKDVRRFYKRKIQSRIDPLLKKYSISYLCDVDPKDVENIKPNQKTDRQILFWIAVIVWIAETIYEFVFPAKPQKKKSKIGGSKKTTESEEPAKTTDTKKSKRDKIE